MTVIRPHRRIVATCSLVACAVLVPVAALVAQPPLPDAPRVGLYDTVAAVLRARWPDRVQADWVVTPLTKEHRARADSARTFGEEVAAVQALLREIPVSHLGLTSESAAAALNSALSGKRQPMYGLQLMRWEGRWYATGVLDGGPARAAGIREWDEVLLLNGVPPDRSPFLDYSTDDAYLRDERDPPVHSLIASERELMRMVIREAPGRERVVDVEAAIYGAWDATRASATVIERDSLKIGYVHLWLMHTTDVSGWFAGLFDDAWRAVDVVVIDARGRGGDGGLASRLAEVVDGKAGYSRYRGPVVVLQDRQTRSAKEVLVDLFRTRGLARLVGEPTAGAVVGSGSHPLGHGMRLLMPVTVHVPAYERLELHPTVPDVAVPWGGPLSGGRDPILEAGVAEARRLVAVQGRGLVMVAPLSQTKQRPVLRPAQPAEPSPEPKLNALRRP